MKMKVGNWEMPFIDTGGKFKICFWKQVASYGNYIEFFLDMSLCLYHKRRIYTEEQAKVVSAVWGDIFECRTSHLAARRNWRKFIGRTSILAWQGGGSACCEKEIHPIVPIHPFSWVSIFLLIHFFISSWL